jgi:uncharacterized protein (DUF305 family)
MKKPSFLLASLFVVSGLLSSCESNKSTEATSGNMSAADSTGSMAGMDHSAMAGGNTGMMGAMNTMMKDMEAVKPAGNTDLDFASMMLAHHRGAVEMSALELKEGKDATLRAMAEKISADQQREMQELTAVATRLGGAAANYKPNDPADPFTNKMKGSMDGMMHMGQPTGNVDMDYVSMMVPHHQSAVDMAKAELAHGRDTKLKQMAQQMVDAQQKEIQQFLEWQAKNGNKMNSSAGIYECPMGDGGKSNAPGKCPKCGMDLEKKG